VFSTDKAESHTISIGKYFVSEIVICRTGLITSIGQSPISSVKPFCGCISSNLSEPKQSNGKISRELLFTVRGVKTGDFRSKIEVIREDGTSFDLLVHGDVISAFDVSPRVLDLTESGELRLVTLSCGDASIKMEDVQVSVGDDRFVLSSVVKSGNIVQFKCGLSPGYETAQLMSQREIMFRIQVKDRQFSIALPIKHKLKSTLVPSTLMASKIDGKVNRVFLIGSIADLKRVTGLARIQGDVAGSNPISFGSFQRRTEDTGVFEFKIDRNDSRLDSISVLSFELESMDDQDRKTWIKVGSVNFQK
jgi:hypothetical protein